MSRDVPVHGFHHISAYGVGGEIEFLIKRE
jgi:hypothetical protein